MGDELILAAQELLKNFRGTTYAFGSGALDQVGVYTSQLGKSALVVGNTGKTRVVVEEVIQSLNHHGIDVIKAVPGAQPNTPAQDVYRIADEIRDTQPDVLVAVGGGSTIDAVKAAAALAVLGGDVERFFGTGLVSAALKQQTAQLPPIIAVATAASSGAHLTKYSNITDTRTGQKKLIVDQALVPVRAVFDYGVTASVSRDVTIDGILDGISHLTEVFIGVNEDQYPLVERLITVGLPLLLEFAPQVIMHPNDSEGRTAVGLGTDLGGFAIMIGGTNGAHLNSFSLVDIASHGRACGLLNPYYAVLFAEAVEPQLRLLGKIYAMYGFIRQELDALSGRELALAVGAGMQEFMRSIGAPTALNQLPNYTREHRKRALMAAQDPQLEMKLQNMPIPITAEMVNGAVGSVLQAAEAGRLDLVETLQV